VPKQQSDDPSHPDGDQNVLLTASKPLDRDPATPRVDSPSDHLSARLWKYPPSLHLSVRSTGELFDVADLDEDHAVHRASLAGDSQQHWIAVFLSICLCGATSAAH